MHTSDQCLFVEKVAALSIEMPKMLRGGKQGRGITLPSQQRVWRSVLSPLV